ncbi:hypothetical protein D3C85_1549900 [compost metagenome]
MQPPCHLLMRIGKIIQHTKKLPVTHLIWRPVTRPVALVRIDIRFVNSDDKTNILTELTHDLFSKASEVSDV